MRSTTSRCKNFLQLFQIENHAGGGIRLARDSHFQHVVMPVAMRIIALAEDAAVLFRRKIRIVIEMRRRKFDFARDANHCVLCGSGLDAMGCAPDG